MPMGKSDDTLFDSPNTGNRHFDKLLIFTRLIDHIRNHVESLGLLSGCNEGFIDEAVFPFAKQLKMIADQAQNRLQEVAEENQQRIFGAKDYERSKDYERR